MDAAQWFCSLLCIILFGYASCISAAEVQVNETTQNSTSLSAIYTTWPAFATRFLPVALFVDCYVTLIFYVVGFPGNIVSFIVWSSRRVYKGNSAAVYLAAVSFNDLVVLTFALFRDLSRSWHVTIHQTPGTCEVKNTLTPAVQYASPLFVLGFTVERWLAICRPFAIDRICSTRRAINICIMIIVGTIIVCLGNAYIFETTSDSCSKRITGSTAVSVYLTLLEVIFSGAVPLLALFFNCLVIREISRIHQADRHLATLSGQPSITPSTDGNCNALSHGPQQPPNCCTDTSRSHTPQLSTKLIDRQSFIPTGHVLGEDDLSVCDASMSRSRPQSRYSQVQSNGSKQYSRPSRTRHVSSKISRSSESRHSPSFRSTTFMLLIVSFYMIATTLLGGLMYLLHQIQETPPMDITEEELLVSPEWKRYLTLMTIKTFGDEIALSYYALGFIIYYATGPNFRHRVHHLLRRILNRCGCRYDTRTSTDYTNGFKTTSGVRRTPRQRYISDENRINMAHEMSTDPCEHSPIRCDSTQRDTKSTDREENVEVQGIGINHKKKDQSAELISTTAQALATQSPSLY